MVIVDKETFEQEVEKSDLPVIVDIWGTAMWPMPCIDALCGKTFRGI